MPSKNYVLTPEQLALSEARKRKKAEAAANATSAQREGCPSLILPRKFLTTSSDSLPASDQAVVMSWNVCERYFSAYSVY